MARCSAYRGSRRSYMAPAIKISEENHAATQKAQRMIESGFWIFLVEAGAAGLLFAGLIWWVVRGTGDRDRKLREADEKLRKAADEKSTRP